MRRFLTIILLAVLVVPPAAGAAPPPLALDPVSLVDPMIGTLGAGFTFPGAAAPYGMVQVSPDTDGVVAYTGYQWFDRAIRGFSMVHTESMGVPEGGNVPLMPTTGPLETDVLRYQAPFTHVGEEAHPGSYGVDLPSTGIRVELAAGLRSGMQRYTFPSTTQANVIIDAGRQIDGGRMIPEGRDAEITQSIPGTNRAAVHAIDDRTIAGSTNLDHNVSQDYGVHFVARFDRPFVQAGGWDAGGPHISAPTHPLPAAGQGAGAYAQFDTTTSRTVTVRIGISFVSEANALTNLESEIGGTSFDDLVLRTRADWRDALGAITVEGGTIAQQRSFYTALYHAQHHPNIFEDANGEYLGHDNAVHTITEPAMAGAQHYYTNFSLWDTYRGEMQLLATIVPERMTDMMRSMTTMAEQGGRLPRWALMNKNPDYMQGEPALIVAADTFCRGLIPADLQSRLYAAMRHVALDGAGDDPRDAARFSKGYIPKNPSGTLEHSLAAFGMALVADRLGNAADRETALTRSRDWTRTFDAADSRFFRPRNADGSWVTPFVPENGDGWTEGTAWHYLWLVPHDIAGLLGSIDAGQAAPLARTRLDTFFSWPLSSTVPVVPSEAQQKLTLYGIGYAGNQYAPSNETDLQAPYLYDWTGEPWKSQAIARQYQSLFRPTPDGLPGNDDLGSMSAWLIWSDLGFYPAVGGAPIYATGSPLFDRAVIRVPGGTVTVDAAGASEAVKYISSATVNGEPLTQPWIGQSALQPGTTISFSMSPVPNPMWGSKTADAPPSISTTGLASFGCR